MKKLFSIAALAVVASALVSISAHAQTFSDGTKYTNFYGTRIAQHTSSTTGTYDTVADTRANMYIIASSSVAGVTGTLTLADKNGRVISSTAVTLNVTPTEIGSYVAPLKFQQAKLTLGAPGAATVSDTRIFTRQ